MRRYVFALFLVTLWTSVDAHSAHACGPRGRFFGRSICEPNYCPPACCNDATYCTQATIEPGEIDKLKNALRSHQKEIDKIKERLGMPTTSDTK